MPLRDGWKWIQNALAFERGGFAAVLGTTAFNHADQIYVLPSLLALAIGPLVDYSYRAFAFATVALLIALGAMFYRLARDEGLGPLPSARTALAPGETADVYVWSSGPEVDVSSSSVVVVTLSPKPERSTS